MMLYKIETVFHLIMLLYWKFNSQKFSKDISWVQVQRDSVQAYIFDHEVNSKIKKKRHINSNYITIYELKRVIKVKSAIKDVFRSFWWL